MCVYQDLALFERQWSSFFASLNIETQLSMQELSEAVAGEVYTHSHTYTHTHTHTHTHPSITHSPYRSLTIKSQHLQLETHQLELSWFPRCHWQACT